MYILSCIPTSAVFKIGTISQWDRDNFLIITWFSYKRRLEIFFLHYVWYATSMKIMFLKSARFFFIINNLFQNIQLKKIHEKQVKIIIIFYDWFAKIFNFTRFNTRIFIHLICWTFFFTSILLKNKII